LECRRRVHAFDALTFSEEFNFLVNTVPILWPPCPPITWPNVLHGG